VLIKIADGKVSAVHGGDSHDYSILDMRAIFETTIQYLDSNFKGSSYMEGSGAFDHSIVSAMWELGGNQELLDTYRNALADHGMSDKMIAPAVRLTTSDVAASGANLYPMLLCDSGNRTISLGSPIKLAHTGGANLVQFMGNLRMLCSRYQDAVADMTKLMDIEIRNPLNCLKLVMKRIGIRKKLINEVAEMFENQNGTDACTAHDLYFAINEACFFAACEGMQGHGIISLEEQVTRALALNWKEYDVNFIYTIYRFIYLYIYNIQCYTLFYNKLYGLPQKFLTCMPDFPMQPVILLCRLTAGFQIRALVAVILYSLL